MNEDSLSRYSVGTQARDAVDPVRLAVVGHGYWGPNLSRVLHERPESEVLYTCDLRQEVLESTARRYPTTKTTTDIRDILDDEAVEAIVLATPVSTHYPLGRACLAAGKHVFIEKPLASSSAEAAELVALAEDGGLVLMPGHTFLYSPPVNLIRELIEAGELGDIHFISMSRVNLGLHQPDVGVGWDLGPHDFSILRYWLRESPVRVAALGRGCIFPSLPDIAFINLEFASSIIAHIEISWLAPSRLRRTTIVGSRKMVVYDDGSNEPVRIFDSGATPRAPDSFGEFQLTYRSGDVVSPRIDVVEPLSLEMQDFCRAIRGGGEPRSTAALGLDVVRVCEAVDRSLAQNGVPVEVPAAD